ncbi:hypothetical protein IT779_08715 [Nocardia sp. NEAU-351]|uniref:Uncharacterized protein n=1 Tax=Nocardia bovistercoris TaxID=2785916 RepID=A0A931I818_9NOCA|nr:hypothetical protein [Nocardia bovistercoris]
MLLSAAADPRERTADELMAADAQDRRHNAAALGRWDDEGGRGAPKDRYTDPQPTAKPPTRERVSP